MSASPIATPSRSAPPAELIVDSPTTIANAGSTAFLANNGLLLNNGVVLNELSATVNNSGVLDNNATISNRLAGAFNTFTTLNNNSGGFLTNDSSSTLANHGTLNNNAGATLSNFGTFTNGGLSELNNRAGATLDNFGTLTTANILNNAGTLNNSGTLVADLTFQLGPSSNSGLLQTTGGSTQIFGNFFHNSGGTIAVAAGGTVALDATIIGGTLENTGGSLGALLSSSRVDLDGNSAGAVTIKGTYTNAPGSGTSLIGTIINRGDIRVVTAGGLDSILALAGTVVLQGGGTITLADLGGGGTSTLVIRFGNTLTNVDNTIQGAGNIGGGDGLHIDNQAAGTILANTPGDTLTINGPSLTNAGTVRVAAGSTLICFPTLVQIGGKTIVDGTLTLESGEMISGGMLLGTGFINYPIQMAGGTIQPGELGTPGTLTLLGGPDLHFISLPGLSSTVFNELIDTSGNGLLVADGNIVLGPDTLLNIDLLGGFTPFLGENFTLMDFSDLIGVFANAPVTGFEMDGFNWTIAYDPTDIVLTAGAPVTGGSSVPDSGAGTLALLALGLLALAAASRPPATGAADALGSGR